MKICDRCWNLDGKLAKSVTPVQLGHEIFDLCLTCSDAVKSAISEKKIDKPVEAKKDDTTKAGPKRKAGRPRKK